jgi:tetratricopeptide (TPR) repeat protein
MNLHSRRRSQVFRFAVVSAAAIFMSAAIPRPVVADVLDLIDSDIQSWRLDEARSRLDKLAKDTKSSPRGLFLAGRLLFFEGDLDKAENTLLRAVEQNREETSWKQLRDRVLETKQAFHDTVPMPGKTGRFTYRLDPQMDELLISRADEALTRQFDYLTALFGDSPKRPIEVAILSDAESLAAASGLSAEQIERTGTVGITKYGRILIISPRSLVSGYPWIDTLAHELTHFFVTRASRDRAPIWLHEGIAKLLESRWQSSEMQVLSPEEAYLLDRAVKEGRLIPLRRFYPSVAYLSNQEDAALAYAQVLSFLRYLNERLQKDWIKRLISGLGQGSPIDATLKSLSGADLQRLYGWWRKDASLRRHTPTPVVGMMKKKFKRGTVALQTDEESVHKLDVRKYLRVGDLLRLRGHLKAAAEEFEQARKTAQFTSPEISDRLGATLIELGEFSRAEKLLLPMTELYPFHAAGFVLSARAYTGLSENMKAVAALLKADAVNPFDPEIHCMAAGLYRELGDMTASALENDRCRMAVSVQKGSENNAEKL